jgi:hypothetical protein
MKTAKSQLRGSRKTRLIPDKPNLGFLYISGPIMELHLAGDKLRLGGTGHKLNRTPSLSLAVSNPYLRFLTSSLLIWFGGTNRLVW